MSLNCFNATTYSDQTWQIFQQLGGGGGGGPIQLETAPTTFSDSSMFPGGVFPATGAYQAYDENYIWSFDASVDTGWQQSARSN